MSNTEALRKAAEAALECLESLQGGCTDSGDGTVEAITVWCPEIIDALTAALAQPAASGEPVADPHAYSRRCAAAELERGPWGKHAAQPAPARVNEGAKGGV